MFSDLRFIIFWWFTIFLLGTVSLPLVFAVFKKFWDKGYIFSKIISLSLLTYIIFVFGIIKVLPFTNLSLSIIIILSLIADFLYLNKRNRRVNFLHAIKTNYKSFIFEELLFLIILIAWSFVRGFAPNIEGLEKYMDWGFVNSALRSTYMPPADMWFAGSPINYYYFGHLIVAVITKLSSIPSSITYNLAVATICALTFVSGFSLTSNLTFNFLKKKLSFKIVILSGLISGLLLTFGGNLQAVYKIASIDIKQNNHLDLSKTALTRAATGYWYPDATRFIGYDPDTKDKTIHEFPVYSFVVADLHGHMNDIPIILLFSAVLFALTLSASAKFFNIPLIISSGLILSIAYMTNAWDFAIYGLLFGFFTLFNFLLNNKFITAMNKVISHGLLVIAAWYLFSLPFSINFVPMTEGLRVSDVHSPFYQLFILYGGFWLITFPFALYSIYKLINQKIKNFSLSDTFVLGLITTATLLIIIPEIGYIKDIYIYDYRRANTMFKLVYEAFIMYSIAAGYVLFRLNQAFKNKIVLNTYRFVFLLIFLSQMIYPYFAIKSFYGFKEYQGLDGFTYLKNIYPSNYTAINWINQNITGQPVILEAVGDSYTTFDQVSSATGLPTIEGWLVHEWLWRGGYDKPGARAEEVRKVYEAGSIQETKSILQKYNVQYIFVGAKEYEKYPNLNPKKFEDLGAKLIFETGATRVYKI